MVEVKLILFNRISLSYLHFTVFSELMNLEELQLWTFLLNFHHISTKTVKRLFPWLQQILNPERFKLGRSFMSDTPPRYLTLLVHVSVQIRGEEVRFSLVGSEAFESLWTLR